MALTPETGWKLAKAQELAAARALGRARAAVEALSVQRDSAERAVGLLELALADLTAAIQFAELAHQLAGTRVVFADVVPGRVE
jgi:hypothetical protein